MLRAPLAILLVLLGTCGPKPASSKPTPTPVPTVLVPEGYHSLGWETPRTRVQSAYSDLHPSKNPRVLVRETTANGMPATEAFFFDAKDQLEEVELRFTPKRNAAEAADLARGMDASMGPHDVPLADDNAYQLAWVGVGTEVRLSYDLRNEVAFGPVVSWAPVGSGSSPVASHPSPIASALPSSGSAGSCFRAAVQSAREGGMHLTGVEGGRGKLTLVYESAGDAKEINLTGDPHSQQKLIGCGSLSRASTHGAVQFRAEGCLDTLLGKGPPLGLKSGGPGGLGDLLSLTFKDGGYISLRPGSADAMASSSCNSPKQ